MINGELSIYMGIIYKISWLGFFRNYSNYSIIISEL